MKTRNFEIPADQIIGFAQQLEELELGNEIKGISEDEEKVLINVFYESNERQSMFVLQEWVEENIEQD